MAGLQTGVDLKDKEQVKEYLENLGTEYRFHCYHEKDPEGNVMTTTVEKVPAFHYT